MATLLGIDLGHHSVKLALMEGRLGRVELSEFRQRRVVPSEGQKASVEDRLEALRILMSEGLESSNQVMGFPTERASVRSLEMPFSDPGQIDKTLSFELEGHVPFDLDDFVLDYRIARGGRAVRLGAEGKSLVLCGLAAEESVEAWIEGAEAAGADPRQTVLDADLLGYLAEENRVQLVVDIGHQRTLVAFCAGGEVLDVRAIEAGGLDLTQALMVGERTFQEAEGLKHVSSLAPDPDNAEEVKVAELLQNALSPLIAQLRTSIFSIEGRHGLELEEILLSGGGSHLKGLPGALSKALALPARLAGMSEEAQALPSGARYALAHGLGQRAAGVGGRHAFDFRKGRLAHAGSLALGKSLRRYGAVALLFFAIGGVVLFGLKRSGIQGEISEVRSEMVEQVAAQFPDLPPSALEGGNKAFNTLLDVAGQVGERVSILESTVAGEPQTLSLLKELSEALPAPGDARVEVTNLTISETSIVMKAKTTGYEAASTIEQAIQSKERFKEATRGDETKQRNGLTFSITIPMETQKEDEEEEG